MVRSAISQSLGPRPVQGTNAAHRNVRDKSPYPRGKFDLEPRGGIQPPLLPYEGSGLALTYPGTSSDSSSEVVSQVPRSLPARAWLKYHRD